MKYFLNYKGTEAERFERNIRRLPSGCWRWLAYKKETGYGKFTLQSPSKGIHGKVVQAHRYAFETIRGKVPEGLELDHTCKNPWCVNPFHLEAVTHLENMRRGKRANQTHCKHGHALSGNNVRKTVRQRVCRECERISAAKKYRRRKQQQQKDKK